MKDVSSDAIRRDVYNLLRNDVVARMDNKTITPEQMKVLNKLRKVLKEGDAHFWKLFRIHLSNLYGYHINDIDEFEGDVEYLDKSWDQTDIFTKHPMNTINDRIKHLINSTFEVDPNSVQMLPDGNKVYTSYTNTPTGFANTLNYTVVADKLYDLMQGKLTKEEMLDELIKYATVADNVFAKTLYSIHDKLISDSSLLTAWFTAFDKMVVDSYRTLNRTVSTEEEGDLTETTITLGNKKTAGYILANNWTNIIVSRGETGYYNEGWLAEYNDLYIQADNASNNFTTLNRESAKVVSDLFKHIGIDIRVDALLGEFAKGKDHFKEIIKRLDYLKSNPTKKEQNGYIDHAILNRSARFNEFGNLLELGNYTAYYRDDVSSHSELNIKNNLVYDLRNPNFVFNFFKKLGGSENSILELLVPYTKVPSNQHSFLLWGDEITDGKVTKKGRGLLNFTTKNGVKEIHSETPLNKVNLANFKFFGYSGSKDLSESTASEYYEMNKHDWAYESLLYFIAKGKYSTDKNTPSVKLTAMFPMLNPSDRKNTLLFEAPVINLTVAERIAFVDKHDLEEAKKSYTFRRLRTILYDAMVDMDVARKYLFEVDEDNRVVFENGNPKVKESILNNTSASQIHYHYKLDDEGNKHYLEFKEENGRIVIDTKRSGNVFNLALMTVLDQNIDITFNEYPATPVSFITHYFNSIDLDGALKDKVNDIDSYLDKMDKFVARFIVQRYKIGLEIVGDFKDSISTTYLKNENINAEEVNYIIKDKTFNHWVLEFVLNTYIFNIEQTRLFHGTLADYKNANDLNKRGGQIVANGLATSLRGVFYGATISDIKIKSKVYRNMAETMYYIKTGEKLTNSIFNKFNQIYTENPLTGIEREVYDIISPYLLNDSANAVSLITFDEFVKRIEGFGLSAQYSDIINKITNGIELDREETTRFASMQKNFYYELMFNEEMSKMVPIQIKNSEIVLTPKLIKDLELEDLNIIMKETGLSQINTISAEKEGSFHVSTIHDINGKLLPLSEVKKSLIQSKREYKYENLRMQQETPDALYEENITLGRQIMKKMIENIFDNIEYNIAGKIINGEELKLYYFNLLVSNINQDRDAVLLDFGAEVDNNGNLIGEPSIDKLIEIIEEQAIDRGLSKNMIYGVQKDENTNRFNVPLSFGAYDIKIQNLLTSIFTKGINNQTFPGLHAPQMSSLFLNRKKGVKQSELQNSDGIQWLAKIGLDTKLKSHIVLNEDGIKVIAAQVLLPRWAKEFYENGKPVNINDLPEEVRMMIGYRIPTEAKYSIYRFEVVGFLPDDNGPAIVLPDDFVTQTGADFDFDTVYVLTYNLHRIYTKEGSTVETIKYIEDKKNIAIRVEAVLEDRKQLVHILSKKYNTSELLSIITELTETKIEGEQLREANAERDKELKARIEVLNSIITSTKGKNQNVIWEKYELQGILYGDSRTLPLKETDIYKQIKKDVTEVLFKLTINDQNTKKARQNRILDIYSSILTNLIHYEEIISTSNFKDISTETENIDKLIKNPITNINNFTFDGQQKYRDLSHQGRSLKGISIALDRFNSIANVAHIELNNELLDDFGNKKINTLPKIKYKVNNSEIVNLKQAYGKDIEIESISNSDQSYVTIVHRFVGNNPAGTFTGIHNKRIDSYSAQTTANILDNVTHRLPNNVGNYMTDVWKLLPSIGSTFRISTLLVNQPILRELVEFHDKSAGTMSAGREIEEIKRKYQTLLYRTSIINDKPTDSYWDASIAKGESIYVNNDEKSYSRLGYTNGTRIVLDEELLTSNINYSNSNVSLENISKEDAKKLEDFAKYQLQVLETYKIYRTYASAISDTGMILNTDKIGAGPTFDTTAELKYNMLKLHDSKILTIGGESVIEKVFPELFGLFDDSVYPTLQAFYKASNLLSYEMFAKHFTGHTPLFNIIKRKLHEYAGREKFDKNLSKEITEYFNAALLKDLPWLNTLTREDKQNLLGINREPITRLDLSDENALQIFDTLSVANQIRLLVDNYGETNSFLSSINIHLQAQNIKKNEFHKIEYNNIGLLDVHSQAFNNLWYSDNIYERIIARNIVRYEYLINGFKFGFGSFSKVLPNNIFKYNTESFTEGVDNEKGIGLSTHLFGKLDKLNQSDLTYSSTDDVITAESLLIFNSHYRERFLKSHYENDTLVPNASRWFQNGKRVIQPNETDGIIRVSAKQLHDSAASRTMNRIKARDIIKVKYGKEWQLYQRDDRFVVVDDKGNFSGSYYYYPINRLETFENEQESIFPSNNIDHYYKYSLNTEIDIMESSDYQRLINILGERQKASDAVYKEELEVGKELSAIKSGDRIAITVDDTIAQKFATLRIGDYVKIKGTEEYIKITQDFKHLNTENYKVRHKWAEDEGQTIEESHKLEGKTNLFQAKFIYIGNLDAVIRDGNLDNDDVDNDIIEDNSIIIKSTVRNFSKFQAAKDAYLNGEGIWTMRPNEDIVLDKDKHFGNPFSQSKERLARNVIVVPTIKQAVEAYKNWLLGTEYSNLEQERRKWILEQINNGSLKGKTLIYYKPGNYYSHADALNDLINGNINPQGTLKFSSYSSSVSPEINNAITTGDEFVKTVYSNLKTRAKLYSNYKNVQEVYKALNQLDIKEELTKLDLADLSTALIHILNYMNVEFLTPKTEDYKGGIQARITEFENANIYDLVNDPNQRRDFINQMRYTLSFLQGVTVFDKLESTSNTNLTSDEKLVNDQIIALQSLMPVLKNTRVKFDRLLKEFQEINLRRFTSNPEIKDGVKNIMDAGDDESYIQLQLDALADTNNPFIANMIKQYSVNMIKADDQSSVDIGELEALLRKTFNKNITALTDADFSRYLEYKNNRRTGKLIQKYDWDAFYAEKDRYFKEIRTKYGNKSEEYYNAASKWYKENEERAFTEEEIDAIVAQKERDLIKPAFDEWKWKNLRNVNGKREIKVGTSHLATPTDKYINPEWTRIKDDVLYQKFVEIIDKYSDYFGKATILTKGFIPTMTPEEKRNLFSKEGIESWIASNKAVKQSESYVGENNEMVYILTAPMIEYFSQEKEIKISPHKEGEEDDKHIMRVLEETRLAGRGNFKSLYEIYAENKRIRKENDEYHAGKIDYNLGNVFSKFIREASRYKAKMQMKHEFDLALYQLKNADFYKRDSKGKLIKDKDSGRYKYDTGESTNLAKHYSQWLEAIFYGNWDIDEGSWTQISKILLKFTSAKNMWLNFTAGINNVQFGKLQVRLEAVAGWYFKNADLNKADALYIAAIPDIIRNLGSTKAGNLTTAIIKRLDITQNTNERDYTTGMLKQSILSSSTFYLFNDFGEHYMQNVNALAMTNHARIINGKIVSLADYQFNNYKEALYKILNDKEKVELDAYLKIRYDVEEFKESKKDYLRDYILALPINKSNAFIKAKKEIDKTSEEEFNKHARLIDVFELDSEGYAILKDEVELDGKKYNTKLDENEFALFKRKVLKVVQKEQGIYNREDAGMVQRRGLGKLAIQFRKYMRPGWNKRFGTKFGKSFWTESRDEWDKGMYTSLFHFLKTGIKRNYDSTEGAEIHATMGKILNDMWHFATNVNVYWNTLDDFDKGNIRRVLLEQLYLIATIAVAMMLKGLKPDDDDDENFLYDLTVYEIDRLYSNTMMYNPIGLINEGQKILKSPAAAQGTVMDAYKLLSSLVGYPFRSEDERVYKTGVYAKESKIMVNAIKLVPILNKYQQLQRINKLNKYYILFRG